MNPAHDDDVFLSCFELLALAAGARIMEVSREGIVAEAKLDASPVTQADRDAEAIILAGLRRHFPGVPVVAEEEASAGLCRDPVGDSFFLVDPLDGTREFVRGGDDFTVNIALVRSGVPVVGVVYAPAMHALYAGRPGRAERIATDAGHRAAGRLPIAARLPRTPPVVVASRSHGAPETDAFIARLGEARCVLIGSSLKFCLLAAGEADLYPRFSRTMQWDTAAGDAVLRAAGGGTRTPGGEPFRYGPGCAPGDAPFANGFFIAEGRRARS